MVNPVFPPVHYKTGGSGIARDVGEKMTMEECLYAVMLESANEVCLAGGEHVAGSVKSFVDMMNEESQDRLLGFGPEGHLTLLLPCPFLACFLAGITRLLLFTAALEVVHAISVIRITPANTSRTLS